VLTHGLALPKWHQLAKILYIGWLGYQDLTICDTCDTHKESMVAKVYLAG